MKRSALFQIQQKAGARFAAYHGWEVPEVFAGAEREAANVRAGVGLADVSWMVKVDLKGPGAAPEVRAEAGCWQLGASRYLAMCEPSEREALLTRLPADARWTDVTSVYAALLLAGPQSPRVLRKLTSLNVSESALPDGGCAQAGVAHVHAIVVRRDLNGLPAFLVLVSREYAEGVWEAVLHAGHEFQAAPFGLEAMRQLGA